MAVEVRGHQKISGYILLKPDFMHNPLILSNICGLGKGFIIEVVFTLVVLIFEATYTLNVEAQNW